MTHFFKKSKKNDFCLFIRALPATVKKLFLIKFFKIWFFFFSSKLKMWFYRGWEGLLWHVVKKFYKKIKIFFSSKGSQPRRNDIILKFCSFFENFNLQNFYINFKIMLFLRGWRGLLFKGQKKTHFSIFWTNLHTNFYPNLQRLYPIYTSIIQFYTESLLYLYT